MKQQVKFKLVEIPKLENLNDYRIEFFFEDVERDEVKDLEKDLGNLTDNGIVGISISGAGKVGINTTTPTQALDVNGNMNMSKCV